ncbi:hypothetical protein PTSG_11115 [Salpingoeca rosetta]|uniref:Uncharacterized protein n=1 Tax=Salpingoeca rosetta (strain ATCC 50818 / BSB-021) TaxID=946362 RepID=F2US68_SALR5|nr:uncharacterized protein PTSG_11115 [Salpingoeca rosetta]EGD80473.1 hypothetical protein PTSG_11115 [Salpingoeca rosetta]|eukprot:XP_004988037.1 hypothetical protein PTSG_11115 [Salpingoeca rosetta]
MRGPLAAFSAFRGPARVGSAHLQACIYYQSCFDVVWGLFAIITTAMRPGGLSGQMVRAIIYFLLLSLEVVRLLLGNAGNKREKVLLLVAFELLTFVQSTIIWVVVFVYEPRPLEYGGNILFVTFILVEFVVCFPALSAINREEVSRFAMLYRETTL